MKTHSKIIFLFAVILLFINIDTAYSQLRFGVKGGFDISNNRINEKILKTSNRLGYQVGGTVEFMAPVIALGGELSVLYGEQQFDKEMTDDEGTQYMMSDYNYLRVPLNLKKKFSVAGMFGIFIQAGPYIEFKLSGADIEKVSIEDQWKSKSFGAGVNAGAGVELLNHLELGMYYRKSLTDNYEEKDGWENIGKDRPDDWSVNLTYFF